MRKADRLFRIVEYLKARRYTVKAEELARFFSVSVRTIYRDMADLMTSGVPVLGEAGVGYQLDRDHIVKPLMFTLEEVEALSFGAQMVKNYGDEALKKSITHAMNRLLSSFPKDIRQHYENTFLLARNPSYEPVFKIDFKGLRGALRYKNKIKIHYINLKHEKSERTVRPLSIVFFGGKWVLLAWCEKREDFRSFRLDLMEEMEVLDEKFRDEKGKRFIDYCDLYQYSKDRG